MFGFRSILRSFLLQFIDFQLSFCELHFKLPNHQLLLAEQLCLFAANKIYDIYFVVNSVWLSYKTLSFSSTIHTVSKETKKLSKVGLQSIVIVINSEIQSTSNYVYQNCRWTFKVRFDNFVYNFVFDAIGVIFDCNFEFC